jgi:hypothetical protein
MLDIIYIHKATHGGERSPGAATSVPDRLLVIECWAQEGQNRAVLLKAQAPH